MLTNTLFTELTTDEEANVAGGSGSYSYRPSLLLILFKGWYRKPHKDHDKKHDKKHHHGHYGHHH